MKIQEYLENFKEKLVKPNQESLSMSLNNVHADEMFSLVVDGTEAGKLTRVFIAGKKLKPYQAQLHTHRYPLILTVLKGTVTQHVAEVVEEMDKDTVNLSMYQYESPLNGGTGLSYLNDVDVRTRDFVIPKGGQIYMDTKSFHTISCSKGSMWIVEELGFVTKTSLVLGIPFQTENLYTKPEMFQINDKHNAVLKEVHKITTDYLTV